MDPVNFCYWLQGYFELCENDNLTDKQVEIIKNHLGLVFEHVIDAITDENNARKKEILQEIHDGKTNRNNKYPIKVYGRRC